MKKTPFHPKKLSKPEPLPIGPFYRTQNKRGYAIERLDPYSGAFVEKASEKPQNVSLEIGAAYGYTLFQAAERGAKHLIANEIDKEHIAFMKQESEKFSDTEFTFILGHFPGDVDLQPASIDNILISRVTHYFTPELIVAAIKKIFLLLKSGGKVFLISETPYGKSFEHFIPIYENKKTTRDPWPGIIEEVSKYMSRYSEDNPEYLHLLDPDVLNRIFSDAGFIIEQCGYFAREEFAADMRLAPSHEHYGHESCGIIARKP
jgi:hypothetical protein